MWNIVRVLEVSVIYIYIYIYIDNITTIIHHLKILINTKQLKSI